MNFIFKFLSSRIVWIIFSTLLIYELNMSVVNDTLTRDSMKTNFFGFLDPPVDIVKLEFFGLLVVIYKIISLLGILALNDMFYGGFLKQLKLTKLGDIDPEEYEVEIVPMEIQNIIGQPSPHAQSSQNSGKINLDKKEDSTQNTQGNDESFQLANKKLYINDNRPQSLDVYLNELQELIGLELVKKEINSIINFIRVNQMRIQKGIVTYDLSYHMVFTGNPGTGKTTVARILANIFRELGIISIGHLIEVDRSGLVAGYMGQTALKVKDVLDRAKGGVLFVDEAYSLANDPGQNDYGKEAIDTLLKYMEDHRNDLIVIVAGYSDPMRTFINSNPGLKSRFNRFIHFEDYSPKNLFEILCSMSEKSHYVYSENAIIHLKKFFVTVYQTERERYGNGRGVRNLFEKIITVHADRMAGLAVPSDEALSVIVAEDVILAIREISRNKFY